MPEGCVCLAGVVTPTATLLTIRRVAFPVLSYSTSGDFTLSDESDINKHPIL